MPRSCLAGWVAMWLKLYQLKSVDHLLMPKTICIMLEVPYSFLLELHRICRLQHSVFNPPIFSHSNACSIAPYYSTPNYCKSQLYCGCLQNATAFLDLAFSRSYILCTAPNLVFRMISRMTCHDPVQL